MRANKFKLPFLAKRTKKEFDRAVDLDPGNIEGRMGELQYYMQAPGFLGGSMEKAREQAAALDKVSKLRGAYATAILAAHEKKIAEDAAAYQRAVERTGRKELARSEYQQSLSINPKLDDAKKALDGLK